MLIIETRLIKETRIQIVPSANDVINESFKKMFCFQKNNANKFAVEQYRNLLQKYEKVILITLLEKTELALFSRTSQHIQ